MAGSALSHDFQAKDKYNSTTVAQELAEQSKTGSAGKMQPLAECRACVTCMKDIRSYFTAFFTTLK